jgi:hypothetical protein
MHEFPPAPYAVLAFIKEYKLMKKELIQQYNEE